MKILLVGHACGPNLGSEPGNTWTFASLLAAQHDVWLICHDEHRAEIETHLAEHPLPRLRIEWVTLPKDQDPWDPAQGERGLRMHYLRWRKHAHRIARELCQREGIQVAQHISWGTVRATPPIARLPVPTIWGPMGGGQTMPWRFRRSFRGEIGREILRSVWTNTLPLRPAYRRAVRKIDLLLVTNDESRRIVERAGARRVEYFLDNGLRPDFVADVSPARSDDGVLRMLWAGRCEQRKALPLALEAMAQCTQKATLTIAGDGPLRSEWETLVRKLGIADRVQFLGRVQWPTMKSLFDSSHVFVFTSLRDSFGSVVLEAMGKALPILTLNHNGVGTFVPSDAGIKVPLTRFAQTATALANAMDELARSPQRRQAMGAASLAFAKTQTWDVRIERMIGYYRELTGAR